MDFYKKTANVAGWLTFLIAALVLVSSVEPTGSLWDCGEFVSGAYKLQVVHPPGAPLFLLVGRLFTWIASIFSDNPSNIAYSVNVMSALCTAFGAMFICWTTMMLGKLSLNGRDNAPDSSQAIALAGAGLAAGLSMAFCVSVWFSAVEGEVYAMSTFFTCLTLWCMIKWYFLPNDTKTDKWFLLTLYVAGLSIGVHLLSLLTFPALALFYYFKKSEKPNWKGALIAMAAGVISIALVQSLIITGIPNLWSKMELLMVNQLGMPFNSGLIPTNIILLAILFFTLRYANRTKNAILEKAMLGLCLVGIGFSTVAVVVIRANANPPINMNNPSDAMRLVPYLNREQYGERPILKGPQFDATPISTDTEDRYGKVGNKYAVVDYKMSYDYKPGDDMFFPRMSHTDENRKQLYRIWMDGKQGKPNFVDNITFFWRYQINWMYWRYFMWNFVGKQNADQGFFSWNPKSGNWLSGISFIDSGRLYNQSEITDAMKNDQARNRYFFLPLIFGIAGLIFHYKRNRKDFLGLVMLFLITGIGIIIYTNEPPNEPRERDYVLVGSFFTFCIWIGMGTLAIFELLRQRIKLGSVPSAALASILVLTAPALMAFQNYDDMGRRNHYAMRDYASNFLNSVEKNAIVFTYGDNDTYPLWYAQEVEGVRPDVRVINLSLIAVDWYIEQMRRKVNESPAIKFTIPSDKYRGYLRNQVFIHSPDGNTERPLPLAAALKFIGEDHPLQGQSRTIETYLPSNKLFIPVDKARAQAAGLIHATDSTHQGQLVDVIPLQIGKDYVTKDDLAILDIISSNLYERPIYFGVTVRDDKLLGLGDYTELQGFGLKVVPYMTPSEKNFGIYGSGSVNMDSTYNIIMNKFKWGNFDKMRLFVDKSYTPSINAHQLIMLRTAFHLLNANQKEKAIQVVDKYFEGFPNMNFTFDNSTLPFIALYLQAGAFDHAKPQMKTLANETAQNLRFYYSTTPEQQQTVFGDDIKNAQRVMNELLKMADDQKDTELKAEFDKLFGPYKVSAEKLKE